MNILAYQVIGYAFYGSMGGRLVFDTGWKKKEHPVRGITRIHIYFSNVIRRCFRFVFTTQLVGQALPPNWLGRPFTTRHIQGNRTRRWCPCFPFGRKNVCCTRNRASQIGGNRKYGDFYLVPWILSKHVLRPSCLSHYREFTPWLTFLQLGSFAQWHLLKIDQL